MLFLQNLKHEIDIILLYLISYIKAFQKHWELLKHLKFRQHSSVNECLQFKNENVEYLPTYAPKRNLASLIKKSDSFSTENISLLNFLKLRWRIENNLRWQIKKGLIKRVVIV